MGVAIFCGIMPFSVSASTTKVMYKSGNKTISYSESDQGCRQFFINDVTIFDGKYFCANDWRLYSTGLKNTVVLYFNGVEADAFTSGKTWNFLNLGNSKNLSLLEEYASEFYGHKLYINDNIISDKINENKCNDSNIANMSQANKVSPVFSGLLLNNNSAYSTNTKSPLKCIYSALPEGDATETAQVVESTKRILGVKSDLNTIYFSATGKGWTAYYAYNIKANKITKTTLANINKNKIKLTLVESF